MAKEAKAKAGDDPENRKTLATTVVLPSVRHGLAIHTLSKSLLGESKMDFMDCAEAVVARAEKVAAGDPQQIAKMLAMQATTLDAVFTEMARRMALNMGDYLGATQTYARIALKAQAGSRASLEAIAKLHQPREQTVRHVHVNEGGQAVIADEFHHHTGGQENGQSSEQPHATGTGATGAGPSLPSPDPIGQAVPVASGEGQPAMPNARRQGKRRA